jgi:spore coat protein U-like protein
LPLLLLLALVMLPAPARAQDCRIDSRAEMEFGTFDRHGGQVTASLPFSCINSSGRPMAFTVCLGVGGGETRPGGRRMVNEQGDELAFDLYSDPAGTQPISPVGSGYPAYAVTLRTAGNGRVAGTMNIYGRIPPGQHVGAASLFRSRIDDAYIHYAAAPGEEPPAIEECEDGAGARTAPLHLEVTAAAANDCLVLVSSDLQFGAVFQLNEKHDQSTTISFQCPKGTDWRVGLDDGLHFNGEFRGMAGPGGTIAYDLYRNAGRSQRWGDLTSDDYSAGKGKEGVETLTIYGRVPVQPTPSQGVYTDIITITLIF